MDIYKLGEKDLHKVDFVSFCSNKADGYLIVLTPEELVENNKYFKLHEATVQECINQKQQPRLEVYDEMCFGVLNIISKGTTRFNLTELDFYITRCCLMLITRDEGKLIENVIKEIRKNYSQSTTYVSTPAKALYVLLDKLTSMDNMILKEIESKIAELEERVMEGKGVDFIRDIINLRKRLLFLKRYYEPLLDIAEDLEENENGLIEESTVRLYSILHNRISRLNSNVLNLRDYITQVREAYQAQVDINLNKTMKFFTVITTIFLPLTLIAGWYGMNFEYMPEFKWVYGYHFVIALSLTVVIISLIYFKKNRFLK
ncbi:MAG: CorA family divalent cation transporter [Bacillota bacterium]